MITTLRWGLNRYELRSVNDKALFHSIGHPVGNRTGTKTVARLVGTHRKSNILTNIPICPNRLPAWQRARREGEGRGCQITNAKIIIKIKAKNNSILVLTDWRIMIHNIFYDELWSQSGIIAFYKPNLWRKQTSPNKDNLVYVYLVYTV